MHTTRTPITNSFSSKQSSQYIAGPQTNCKRNGFFDNTFSFRPTNNILKLKVLRAEWQCPLLEMVVKLGMQCCPLVVIGVESCIKHFDGSISKFCNQTGVFHQTPKSLPKLLVSPAGPMATLTRMTKLVTLLYTIRIGHYDSWAFLGHGILIFAFSIFLTQKWWLYKCHFSASIFYSIYLASLYMSWEIASIIE